MFGRYQGFDPKISEKLAADFANQWVEVRQIWELPFVCFVCGFYRCFKFPKKSTCWVCFYQGTGTPKNEALGRVNMDV